MIEYAKPADIQIYLTYIWIQMDSAIIGFAQTISIRLPNGSMNMEGSLLSLITTNGSEYGLAYG